MKQLQNSLRRLGSAAIVLALAASPNLAQADLLFAGFDADATAAADGGQWPDGSSSKTLSWSSIDSQGNPESGSLSNVISWTPVAGWKDAKVNLPIPWPGIDTPNYVNLEFDIKVIQEDSFAAADGSYGLVQIIGQGWSGWGLNGETAYNWQFIGQVTVLATSNWQRVSVSLVGAPPTISQIVLNFAGNGASDPTNVVCYLIDNVVFTTPALPPPTLAAIKPATAPGLTLIPGSGSEWQRVMVYPGPLGSDFGWFNRGNPVTYSFTIREFPPVGEFAANLFLIPNAHMQWGAGDTAGDWNATNTLVLNITANGANPATSWNVGFNAKTNLGGGNPNFNNIVNFNYTQFPTGTWSLTFANNTDFTITAPDGFSTNSQLPLDVAEQVSGFTAGNTALTPYFGIMPRVTAANIGLPSVFSRIKIEGVSSPVDDDFAVGPLNTATWSRLADYTPGIFVNTNDIFRYVTWNTPNDQGFTSLLAAGDVAGPYREIGAGSSKWLLLNGVRTAIVPQSEINAALGGAQTNAAYFRLVKRTFTKLQVLMPGETAAPGTPTGKTGTPTPQLVRQEFLVTVRSVDADWYPVASGDNIDILTSTDPGISVPPFVSQLVGGTVEIPVLFGTAGTHTITATDATDPTKTAGTSSPTSVVEP